jgi:phage terminase large subunit
VGAYYGKEMDRAEKEGRISDVPYDPALPVSTFWDLGIGDTTALWFGQFVGPRVQWIDYIEESGIGIPEYAKRLKDRPYVYEEHYLPHDAAARELGTGRSREESLRSHGIRPTRIVPRQTVDDGIQASRLLLAKSYFDQKKCERGIKSLRNYQRRWNPKSNMFESAPLHDWASHGSDAFRTAAMGMRHQGYDRDRKLPTHAESDFNPFALSG